MEGVFEFDSILVFSFLSIMLLAGIIVRAKVGFIQKYLFPSCFIGGFIGLIFVNLDLFYIDPKILKNFVYHFFNISFISVGLTRSANSKEGGGKELAKGAAWMALVQGVIFPLQAIIGGTFVLLFAVVGIKLFPTFGFHIPLGFIEGPGQALSMGTIWEESGFEYGGTIGLTFATIGFFFAFFIGVPLANWGIRNGLTTQKRAGDMPKELLTGVMSKDSKLEKAGELTLHSSNVETMAFQLALIGLVYLITYSLIKSIGPVFGSDVAKTLFGFFFFFGLCIALLLRAAMKLIGIDYLVEPGIQRRITGLSIDFLIIATVAAIELVVAWKFALPILAMSVTAGILTTLVIFTFGRRLKNYSIERMVAIYGVATGTTANGLLLLRVVDPEFKTPAALELALMNVIVAPIIIGCMVLTNAPIWWKWAIPAVLLVYVLIMAVSFLLLKFLKMSDPPK